VLRSAALVPIGPDILIISSSQSGHAHYARASSLRTMALPDGIGQMFWLTDWSWPGRVGPLTCGITSPELGPPRYRTPPSDGPAVPHSLPCCRLKEWWGCLWTWATVHRLDSLEVIAAVLRVSCVLVQMVQFPRMRRISHLISDAQDGTN